MGRWKVATVTDSLEFRVVPNFYIKWENLFIWQSGHNLEQLNGSADGGIQQKFYCFIFCHLKMNKATKKVFYSVISFSFNVGAWLLAGFDSLADFLRLLVFNQQVNNYRCVVFD